MIAPPAMQQAVAQLVGHRVPNLSATCSGTRCIVTNHRGLVVVLVRKGKRYVVRSAIA